MATTLKQIQSQKQKLAPKQVLNARLLQLNVVNLEQTILKELEQNPTLEQLDPVEEENVDLEKDNPIEDMDVSLEDMYSNESNYYLSEQKKEVPIPDQTTFSENLIDQLQNINLEKNLEVFGKGSFVTSISIAPFQLKTKFTIQNQK